MNNIQKYIDSLFEKYPETTETGDLKREILSNCQERYQDCIKAGMSEGESEKAVISAIGDLSELLNSLVQDTRAVTVIKEEDKKEKNELSEIRLSLISADIRIEPSTGNEVEVEKSGDIVSLRLGNTLVIEEEKNQFHSFRSDRKVILRVPADLEKITVGTKSGDIQVSGISCRNFEVRTMSGDIDGELTGEEISFTTVSGDVKMKLDNRNGNINVNTTSGDVEVEMTHMKEGNIHSISGDVKLKMKSEFDEMKISCVSGDIEVRCDDADVEARTTCGDISNRATHTAGINRLIAKTVSGNIDIR